jgi:segregation and condensation protein B
MLSDAIEALLFVAANPVTVGELSEALGRPESEVVEGLAQLDHRLRFGGGLQLVFLAGGYQLATRPEFEAPIARLLTPNPRRMSRSLLEVLAVVAYRQPTTLAEIEAHRGVQSDYGVRQLLERGLIREAGRKPTPGRPTLYATTDEFLHQFGLGSLADLPALEEERLPQGALPL